MLAVAVLGKRTAAPSWISKGAADWLDSLGSETVTPKCDSGVAIVALAEDRKEGSTTIVERSEEEEKQSNHLAEGSVNLVKCLIRTPGSSTEASLKATQSPACCATRDQCGTRREPDCDVARENRPETDVRAGGEGFVSSVSFCSQKRLRCHVRTRNVVGLQIP